MKIRHLADAAIVAALLLTSIPVSEADFPQTLTGPAPCIAPAESEIRENPAAREPS